jgi:excisionase family DNA binding protein
MAKSVEEVHTLLTIHEVAKFLRLHLSTVYRLAREERLPAIKIGNQWRFHREHIEQWLKEQCRT